MPKVYHFSEEGGIREFVPRAPLAHPEAGAYVYAIDEWHSPFYFFPRDCPRVGIWPVGGTSEDDLKVYWGMTEQRMVVVIDRFWEDLWRDARLFRYGFEGNGFVDTGDHGCWVSEEVQIPFEVVDLSDLPGLCVEAGVEVRVVDDLAEFGRSWMNSTSLHVSMTRMWNLDSWDGPVGKPVAPKG